MNRTSFGLIELVVLLGHLDKPFVSRSYHIIDLFSFPLYVKSHFTASVLLIEDSNGFAIPPGTAQPFVTLTFSVDNLPTPAEACITDALFLPSGQMTGKRETLGTKGYIQMEKTPSKIHLLPRTCRSERCASRCKLQLSSPRP